MDPEFDFLSDIPADMNGNNEEAKLFGQGSASAQKEAIPEQIWDEIFEDAEADGIDDSELFS